MRAEAARLAKLRVRDEKVQRKLQHQAQQAFVFDLIEQLRQAEPDAVARLVEHIHGKNPTVSLAAIRELLDRTRGRPAQTVHAPPRRTSITVITGVPDRPPVTIEVDEVTAAGMDCLLPAPTDAANEMHTPQSGADRLSGFEAGGE